MSEKKMYDLLKKIAFTRISGTNEELECANILKEEIEKSNNEVSIVPFKVNAYDIIEVELNATNHLGESISFNAKAYGYCGEDSEINAPLYLFEGIDEVSKKQANGKIVLVNGFLSYDIYKAIVTSHAVGFICFNGDFKDNKCLDIDQRELRDQLREYGVIPGVQINVIDAIKLVKYNPKNIHIKIKQKQYHKDSHNVIATIKGSEYPNEIIAITAHYDSVNYSLGTYDNGAGSVINMELYHYFVAHPPKRTLKFIWCGSEERGLLGSKAFVKSLDEEEINKYLVCINTDVAGPVIGRDAVNVIGEVSEVNAIKALAKEIGFSADIKQDIYSSDGVPFSDRGIPSINFMRFGVAGTAYIHNRYDTLAFMSSASLYHTYTFIESYVKRIVNAEVCPVERSIPTNMVEKINNYLKKEKK